MATAPLEHEDYCEHIEEWTTARIVVAGEKAVKAAGQDYLPRLEAQTDAEYNHYKKRSKFFSATGRTLNGLHGMLFRKSPQVKCDYEDLKQDVDMAGNTIESYIEDSALEVLMTGRGGTLVDFSDDEKRPYFSFYRAEDILNWVVERVAGRVTLTMLVLKECISEMNVDEFDPNAKQTDDGEVERLRVLRLIGDGASRALMVDVYRQSPIGEGDKKSIEWTLEAETPQPTRAGVPLNFIPFVAHNAASGTDMECCSPPLQAVIDVNLHHYRLSADYDHALFFAANPTAWVAGFPKESQLRIGSSVAWVSENTEAKAGFLEFHGHGLNPLKLALDDDKQEMAVLGARLLEEQKRAAETAEAMRMRQTGDSSVLSGIANNLSMSITKALKMALWWSSTIPTPAEVTDEQASVLVNKDFIEAQMDPTMLRELVSSWQKGAISQDTLLDNLRDGEIIRSDTDNDTERARIEEGAPMLADMLAATRPPQDKNQAV